MFEKDYKNAMDGINPDPEAMEKIRNSIISEANGKNGAKRSRIRIRTGLIAASLCVIFAVSAILVPLKTSDGGALIPSLWPWKNTSEEEKNEPDYTVADGLRNPESYEELKAIISENQSKFYLEDAVEEDVLFEETYKNPPTSTNEPDRNEGNENDYSDTNNQVAGVQEGDIIKTDGTYIYYINQSRSSLMIISASNGNSNVVAEITDIFRDDMTPSEMFLYNGRLAVISQSRSILRSDWLDYYYGNYRDSSTNIDIYDISDKTSPKKIVEHSQSGYYNTARVIDGKLYTVSVKDRFRYYFIETEESADVSFPQADGNDILCEDIYIPDLPESAAFIVITSLDLNDPNEFKSKISLMGVSDSVYVSENAIYLNLSKYTADTEDTFYIGHYTGTTDIYKIALLEGGELRIAASGNVPGYIFTANAQFSMDEYEGYFRIATHITELRKVPSYVPSGYRYENTSYNKVFVLNSELDIIGESESLGENEQIKSVRYMGSIAYVVTFVQTDPLYAIDLSDPTKPETLSELKINGFSQYMQNYGSDYMLGIGYDADPVTGIITGVKLTMFDISDPKNVMYADSVIYEYEKYDSPDNELTYYYSECLYNHKALLIDKNKGIIALPFTVESFGDSWDDLQFDINYIFYSFDGEKLTEAKTVTVNTFDYYNQNVTFNSAIRGLYIGEYAYIVSDSGIISLSLQDMCVCGNTSFN